MSLWQGEGNDGISQRPAVRPELRTWDDRTAPPCEASRVNASSTTTIDHPDPWYCDSQHPVFYSIMSPVMRGHSSQRASHPFFSLPPLLSPTSMRCNADSTFLTCPSHIADKVPLDEARCVDRLPYNVSGDGRGAKGLILRTTSPNHTSPPIIATTHLWSILCSGVPRLDAAPSRAVLGETVSK